MMDWLPGAGASSARLYWESFGKVNMDPVTVPTGISRFPREIFPQLASLGGERHVNLVYWNRLDRGGRSTAFERSAVFVDEVIECR
jgi:hypothetical protein